MFFLSNSFSFSPFFFSFFLLERENEEKEWVLSLQWIKCILHDDDHQERRKVSLSSFFLPPSFFSFLFLFFKKKEENTNIRKERRKEITKRKREDWFWSSCRSFYRSSSASNPEKRNENWIPNTTLSLLSSLSLSLSNNFFSSTARGWVREREKENRG